MMNRNLAAWDRWLRLLAGAFIFSLMFWGPHTYWGLAGLVLVITALVGHCPIYVMLGIRTCPADPSKSS